MTSYKNLISGFFLLALPFCFSQAAAKVSWEEIFFESNKAYKQGDFQKAADGYSSLIQSGFDSGHLHFNMGNAYFRLDRLGEAILNFERARLLIPRDQDLRYNLGHARDQTIDALAEPEGVAGMVFFWLDTWNLAELFRAFATANVFFWAIFLFRLFKRSEWTYYMCLGAVVLWALCGASFGLKWYQTKTDSRSVVIAKEVSVLAGPETDYTILFKLHEGTIVRHERSEDAWSLIRLSDKRRGWVKAHAIERIVFPDFTTKRARQDLAVPISTERRNQKFS